MSGGEELAQQWASFFFTFWLLRGLVAWRNWLPWVDLSLRPWRSLSLSFVLLPLLCLYPWMVLFCSPWIRFFAALLFVFFLLKILLPIPFRSCCLFCLRASGGAFAC